MFGSLRSLFGSWSNSAPRGGLITGASSTPSAQMPLSRKPKLQSLWEAAKATLLDEQPSQQRIAALQDALGESPPGACTTRPAPPSEGPAARLSASPHVVPLLQLTYRWRSWPSNLNAHGQATPTLLCAAPSWRTAA